MPELPEVESIRIQLEKYLVGHRIEDVKIRYGKKFEGDLKDIVGTKVKKVRRFGKVLSIDLDNGFSILVHVKLTGQLIYRGPNLPKPHKLSKKVTGDVPGKHTHVIFNLDKKGKLYFNDVRKFGWIRITQSSKLKTNNDFIKNLGPEPFKDLTLDKFATIAQSTGRSIKTLLMDQSKISGVGNIYANDALWLAEINPKRPSSSLSTSEIRNLFNAIEEVLKEGLKRGGASELAFVTPDGKEGTYQEQFLAYGKEGEICPRCAEGKFKKVKLSGRGTFFCPVCQT
jgi:formamidopyrimidine-DNA glycosylase